MEEPKEIDPESEDPPESDQQKFNRDEFSIDLEETKDGKQTFYVKSEEFFQKIAYLKKCGFNNTINCEIPGLF